VWHSSKDDEGEESEQEMVAFAVYVGGEERLGEMGVRWGCVAQSSRGREGGLQIADTASRKHPQQMESGMGCVFERWEAGAIVAWRKGHRGRHVADTACRTCKVAPG